MRIIKKHMFFCVFFTWECTQDHLNAKLVLQTTSEGSHGDPEAVLCKILSDLGSQLGPWGVHEVTFSSFLGTLGQDGPQAQPGQPLGCLWGTFWSDVWSLWYPALVLWEGHGGGKAEGNWIRRARP